MSRLSKWYKLVGTPSGFAFFQDNVVKLIRDNIDWIELPLDIKSAVKQAIDNPHLPKGEELFPNDNFTLRIDTVEEGNTSICVVLFIPKVTENEPDWDCKVRYTDFIRLLNDYPV